MIYGRQKELHPLLKLAEWLLLIVAAVAVVMTVWLLLPINHLAPFNMLMFQALQAVCVFILPAWLVACLWSEQPKEYLHLKPLEQTDKTLLLLSIATVICALPLINWLAYYNSQITLPDCLQGLEAKMRGWEEGAARMLEAFMSIENGSLIILLMNILILAILPAIGEEFTFRGVLQSFFHRNKHLAVWVTAIVFSFIHFQFYGFIPRMLLGALLGYALVWTDNIAYSITMHATNNTIAVLLFYIATFVLHLPEKEMDYLGTGDTWWLTALSMPLTALCIIFFYRRARSLRQA